MSPPKPCHAESKAPKSASRTLPDRDPQATTCCGQYPLWKRCLDLTCIVITLPFWLPLMIFATLAIKLLSSGPVFFRQQRVGLGGNYFMIFKFRSMKLNVETRSHEGYFQHLMEGDCPMTKLDEIGDPRLILGGRLLRATALDELPQIFNVIRGDMSLVGPRPCTPSEFECYEARHKERFQVPPGLTGYWQVNGKNKTTFSEMIEMDLQYAGRMSVWLDLVIMLRTFPTLLEQVYESQMKRLARRKLAFREQTTATGSVETEAN